MPTASDPKQAAQELAAARALVTRLESIEKMGIAEMKTSLEEARTELKELVKVREAFKDVDVQRVLQTVEEMKAGQEQIRNVIRTSKGGIYVPGLEDEGKKFSIHRAARAITTKDWKDAGFEESVFKAAREAVTKGPGHIVGVDSQGGFWVPDQVIPDIIQQIYAASVFIALDGAGVNRVSVINGLTGIPVTIPKFIGGMVAYWIGEQDKYIESAVKAGNVSMRPRKLGVLTRVTDEMKRFASPGFDALMRTDMVKAAATLIDWTVAYGTGTDNMPRGIINVPGKKLYYAETHSDIAPAGNFAGGELTYDDLMNMQGVVEDQNIAIDASWAWISHPRYFRRRRQDKVLNFSGQTSGQPYLVDGPMMANDRLRQIIGDFGATTAFPTKNNAGQSIGATPASAGDKKYGDVIGANWRDVLFGRWGGLELAEDGGVGKGFPTDESYIKMRMYGDLGYRSEESIVHASDAKMRDA